MNCNQGGCYSSFGKIVMIFFCAIYQINTALESVISSNICGPKFINMHKAGRKINSVLGPPIINITIQ